MFRTLEITILSGEDLRVDGRSIKKKNAFVSVKIDPFNYRETEADVEGGSYPSWNEKLVLDMPSGNQNGAFITLEVGCRCRSSNSGEKMIGIARMPLADFMGGYTPEGYLHFLSYRLRDSYGVKNGIINISVKVLNGCSSKTTAWDIKEEKKGVSGYSSGCSSQAAAAYGGRSGGSYGGVVTGVPVSWSDYRTRA